MAIANPPMSAEMFEDFALLPENEDKILEFIAGEVIEASSNPKSSYYGSNLHTAIGVHVKLNKLGFVTGEAGGYRINGERYAPDVAFFSKAHGVELASRGYNPLPPDLAVEVDYPSTAESQEQLRFKIANYLAAGTIVWTVFPETQTVEVYAPGKPPVRLCINDELKGGDVLPGFAMKVRDIFAT
jgi:Uma2 family endonuclease